MLNNKNILSYKSIYPKIADDAFIAPSAVIIGDVTIGSGSSVWFNCVLRGDVAKIVIGKRTNIQDGTVIHVTRNGIDTIIGDGVTVGHGAILHGCKLQNKSFIGIGATVLDGALVESYSMVGANALVSSGKIISKYQIWTGVPAKFFRNLTEEEIKNIDNSEDNYFRHTNEYIEIIKNYN